MSAVGLVWPTQFTWAKRSTVQTTPELEQALRDDAAIAIGISGGKDSCACAIAVSNYLDEFGHRGPRVLIHADLGRIEWTQSLPVCERLAARLGLELIVVRRPAGDLLARWNQRWKNNVRRYADLECVKLILPWSTAGMRFCTSELKTAQICSELVRRFPARTIVSVIGIRAQESGRRAQRPAVASQPKLANRRHRTTGMDWHPILDWSRSDVLGYLAEKAFELHEAYTLFGSSRVSCAFCILASHSDLRAATTCAANHDVYRALVELEIESTFSFQGQKWLCDVAPHLLDDRTRCLAANVRERAARREAAERRIPKHLLYEKGWPTCMPSPAEAGLLADVRSEVAAAVAVPINYRNSGEILQRYASLIQKHPGQA
jgi:3'-phosphoadenosine 5'-phosphosulfate sulfotransferase (PAPS reductase)/FAD synthetase